MARSRAILCFTVPVFLVYGIMLPAAGQEKFSTDSGAVLQGFSTASQSAILAAFLASLDGGRQADTALSVSNILTTPPGQGFPSGGDRRGPLRFYLYDQDSSQVLVFDSQDHPGVGSGLEADGTLREGGTFTVFLHEIIDAIAPEEERDFVGYAWIVANFDAVSGTYVNFFPAVAGGASQSFLMEPVVGGLVVIPEDNGN